MTAIADRSQRVDGYLRRIIAGKLTRIELRDDSIESPGVNSFELRGIDAPLIPCDLQPCEDLWQRFVDVPALVTADDATGPVN
jgi:hypothetical protein